ncbi:hypothetical protein SmJEL517_g02944 [Synchytrium microbalum]|uniref:Large ribosomal subunit protein mL54 n=1 Tax=Synchytrium microbalum TaxID=1806994 RepID=A0A507C4C8_9FUNG|nr:uncharacterized protein SmJEL517_g02944 [Synchytrium microbalum]TPX34331.1 hypothetical protein SmJEL517_g02944 [Synchytrium microbalum]
MSALARHPLCRDCLKRSLLRHSSTQASPPSATASTSERPESSIKEGTVLKGINVYAGKSDPVAMKDADYPDWLWTLTAPKPKELATEDKLNFSYLRTRWRLASRQKKKL